MAVLGLSPGLLEGTSDTLRFELEPDDRVVCHKTRRIKDFFSIPADNARH